VSIVLKCFHQVTRYNLVPRSITSVANTIPFWTIWIWMTLVKKIKFRNSAFLITTPSWTVHLNRYVYEIRSKFLLQDPSISNYACLELIFDLFLLTKFHYMYTIWYLHRSFVACFVHSPWVRYSILCCSLIPSLPNHISQSLYKINPSRENLDNNILRNVWQNKRY